ncbi:hypothetical protein H4R99_000478 [Coemansia sp. RSA 1722]|nr:hypothetical protein H4R99_000478 [Coemansia sp. RSA 1722]
MSFHNNDNANNNNDAYNLVNTQEHQTPQQYALQQHQRQQLQQQQQQGSGAWHLPNSNAYMQSHQYQLQQHFSPPPPLHGGNAILGPPSESLTPHYSNHAMPLWGAQQLHTDSPVSVPASATIPATTTAPATAIADNKTSSNNRFNAMPNNAPSSYMPQTAPDPNLAATMVSPPLTANLACLSANAVNQADQNINQLSANAQQMYAHGFTSAPSLNAATSLAENPAAYIHFVSQQLPSPSVHHTHYQNRHYQQQQQHQQMAVASSETRSGMLSHTQQTSTAAAADVAVSAAPAGFSVRNGLVSMSMPVPTPASAPAPAFRHMTISEEAASSGVTVSENIHEVIWAQAESHFGKAQRLFLQSAVSGLEGQTGAIWRANVVAGLSCLYGVLQMCEAPREQKKSSNKNAILLGPEIEAKTRLRIAQALGEWAEGSEAHKQEEAHLTRALMILPASEGCVDIRYSIIATQCRLFLRLGQTQWAEQKIKHALTDAQKRSLYRWVHFFVLELSSLYAANGDAHSATDVLRVSAKQAQQTGDKAVDTVVNVQLLGRLVEERIWNEASSLGDRVKATVASPELSVLPQVRSRFWVLQAASEAMLGNHVAAKDSCNRARMALKEWQVTFARTLAVEQVSNGGSCFVIPGVYGSSALSIRGWSYYEAHAWVMLVSAYSARGDDAHEQATAFLRLALEGIKRGEADGFKNQLAQTKLLVLLHIVDKALASLQLAEAKQALDQVMVVVAESENANRSRGSNNTAKSRKSGALWRRNRDCIALRWAMYRHRVGDFAQAMDAYTCVAANGSKDLRFAALANQGLLCLASDQMLDQKLRNACGSLELLLHEIKTADKGSQGPFEKTRSSIIELLQGIECTEPVKAKTHLLACLRICTEIADTAMQGWTLCSLGALVLPTGQYNQAMKMCAAGQAIAQRANDPLQNAAAIGILTHIEKAVGDPERCTKLLQVDKQFLEQFNALIIES